MAIDKSLKPDNGTWKTLKEIDPGLWKLRKERTEIVAVHYFCDDCDYHDRRCFDIPWSIAENFKRPIMVPHEEHGNE